MHLVAIEQLIELGFHPSELSNSQNAAPFFEVDVSYFTTNLSIDRTIIARLLRFETGSHLGRIEQADLAINHLAMPIQQYHPRYQPNSIFLGCGSTNGTKII